MPIRFLGALNPFSVKRTEREFKHGRTVAEYLDEFEYDGDIPVDAKVWIVKDGQKDEIPKAIWQKIRPKNNTDLVVRLFPVPAGGGGGKNIFRSILTLGLVLATSFFLTPFLAGALGATLGGIVSLGIQVGGIALLNAIFPAPKPKRGPTQIDEADTEPSFFIQGARNEARPLAPIPICLGLNRIKPPYGADPYSEALGGRNRLYLLFAWCQNHASLSDFKIGQTPLSSYDDVASASTDGSAPAQRTPLFHQFVNQLNLSVELEHNVNQRRVTLEPCHEVGVTISFPRGLYQIDEKTGERKNISVAFRLLWRFEGSTGEFTGLPSNVETTGNPAWRNGNIFTVTLRENQPQRFGYVWRVLDGDEEPQRVELDVVRVSGETVQSNQITDMSWIALQSYQDTDPIAFPGKLARTALRIEASGQLNSVVSDFSGLAHSYGPVWTGAPGFWTTGLTSNPAGLLYLVLTDVDLNAKAVPVNRLNLTSFEQFHSWCATKSFQYNRYVETDGVDVATLIQEIARAGQAGVQIIDDLYTVIIDSPGKLPTGMIAARDCTNFVTEMGFEELPHFWRTRFRDRAEEYEQREVIVYRDGFSATTAYLSKEVSLPGVTIRKQAEDLLQYYVASAIHRNKRYTFELDWTSLLYHVGDRVPINHDVLDLVHRSSRIASIQTSGSDITGITIDDPVTMEAGKSYGLAIRYNNAGSSSHVTREIVTVAGEQSALTFATSIPDTTTIMEGDLVSFGDLGFETVDALIVGVTRSSDLKATVAAIPYAEQDVLIAPNVNTPETDTRLLDGVRVTPPQLVQAVSNEDVVYFDNGQFEPRLFLEFQASGVSRTELEVQLQDSATRGAYRQAQIIQQDESTILIGGVAQGDRYNIRARYNHPYLAQSAWTKIPNVEIIGISTPPSPPNILNVINSGASFYVQWQQPTEIDVRNGGAFAFFRHDISGTPSYSNARSIPGQFPANALTATIPADNGTYYMVFRDAAGRDSTPVAFSPGLADNVPYVPAGTITENPTFPGAKTNMVVDPSTDSLILTEKVTMDDVVDMDAVADMSDLGGNFTTGAYEFATGFNGGELKTVRLLPNFRYVAVDPDTAMDTVTDMDAIADMSRVGNQEPLGNLIPYFRASETAGGALGPWLVLNAGLYRLWRAEFKFEASVDNEDINLNVYEAEVKIEEPA